MHGFVVGSGSTSMRAIPPASLQRSSWHERPFSDELRHSPPEPPRWGDVLLSQELLEDWPQPDVAKAAASRYPAVEPGRVRWRFTDCSPAWCLTPKRLRR